MLSVIQSTSYLNAKWIEVQQYLVDNFHTHSFEAVYSPIILLNMIRFIIQLPRFLFTFVLLFCRGCCRDTNTLNATSVLMMK